MNKTEISSITDKGGLIRIGITDTSAKAILTKYINAYSFDGKGVYLVNIITGPDSIKYYVGIAFSRQQIEGLLDSIPYYFYDVVNQRVVIFDSKFERFIKPQNCIFDSDTILNRYYDNKVRFREVYFMEFLKVGETVSSKVIHFDPF